MLITLIGQAVSFSYYYGQLAGAVQRNSERIVKLESKDDDRTERDARRDERGARIEAKLDLLMPSRTREEVR